uniref:Uncharacterized protein LOC117366896 n=1 Tax=Geotrypetes seraphini TaxID=260995 RepID=A0A6P8S990_GEOSA|nr:uncharacterized protein LOC117366896 [Geotrypetes seraphini]
MPGGGVPGSVSGCGFFSQSPSMVPEHQWSAAGAAPGPFLGSVDGVPDRQRGVGASVSSASEAAAVDGGVAGPVSGVVVAGRGVTVEEQRPVASAEAAASGLSLAEAGPSTSVSSAGARGSRRRCFDAGAFVEPGREGVWDMLRLSVAPATWSHYLAGFRLVATFLFSRGWAPGDVAESLLEDFVLDSYRSQLSRRVVQGRLAGFAFFCRALGWSCPASGFLVRRLLRACRAEMYGGVDHWPFLHPLGRREGLVAPGRTTSWAGTFGRPGILVGATGYAVASAFAVFVAFAVLSSSSGRDDPPFRG